MRVALTERASDGSTTLVAVAVRPAIEDAAAALRDAVAELATRERRCVFGIGEPEARLRSVALPNVTRRERRAAATFQAARLIDYPVAEAEISLVPAGGAGSWLLGIAHRAALDARYALARRARLTPVAVDDVAFALARVHRDCDGTIDVGEDRTRVTVFTRPVPFVVLVGQGAASLTEGIARSLGVDATVAEERKRTIGFAGAGEAQRDALIAEIARALAAARAATGADVRRLATVGNGSRIPGFAEAIARATSVDVRSGALAPETSATLPVDVLRAAGADWSIAYGLSLWTAA
jgi:Tfp pilus assembly PilM family ATPase